MRRTLSLFLVLLMAVVLLPACSNSGPYELDYGRYQTTEEEVKAQIEKYGKADYSISEDAEFAAGVVVVGVYPFALEYAYTIEDFSEIGCTELRQVGYYPDDREMPTKFLLLKISDRTKRGVLNAIEILIQRDDIYSAQPDSTVYID